MAGRQEGGGHAQSAGGPEVSCGGWALPQFPVHGGRPLTREIHLPLVQLIHPLVHDVRHLVQLLPGWGRQEEACERAGAWLGRGRSRSRPRTH